MTTMVDMLVDHLHTWAMRASPLWPGGPGWRPVLVALVLTGLLIVSNTGTSTAATSSSSPTSVPAVRQPLSTNSQSPVVHDNELMALAPHDGRLFAATDQWEYSGPSAYGQILVKDSSRGPWTVFEQTQSIRVQAVDSFPVPRDQGLGPGHSLLVTQAIVNGRSEIQWLLDGAKSFAPANSYELPSTEVDVRAFGEHESGGVWSIYAGAEPTGVLRGTWSKTRHTLVFNPTPELTAAAAGSPGLRSQKVTAFADCSGAAYVTINTKLYRRSDGALPPQAGRWVLVYEEPPVGAFNSGLRGLTCVTHEGAPSLLLSAEGSGDVYRLDHLPRGQIIGAAAVSPGEPLSGLVSTLEFSPVPALRQMLAAQGTTVPAKGKGSIDYVIAAYNNFETIKIGGVTRQFFGIEHAYLAGCPATRTCGPTAFGGATFDAAACFAVRTDSGSSPSYVLRCLSGPSFNPSGPTARPIRSGQAFVSIRTIKASPFGNGRIYYGGYDCNFYPADGTAWTASSTESALHIANGKEGTTS